MKNCGIWTPLPSIIYNNNGADLSVIELRSRPADILDEVRQAEQLGLGSAWISERYDVKEVGALSGAGCAVIGPADRRVRALIDICLFREHRRLG